MIKKLSLCLLVISTGLVASCVNPFYENSVRRAENWQPQIDLPGSIVVCRQKQCAPSKLSMSEEYIYNSLLHLLDNNSQSKALICRADPASHICTENYLTIPITVGVTPANMYIDDVKITDVSASIGSKSLDVILNYNVTYNGQTPTCKPAKSLVYVKNANNIILEDAGYSCKMTTIGNTTIKTLFAIDYIDLDYGYIGGYYSIGLSGPAFGGDSGYMMLRLPQDAYPLSADLILKEKEKTDKKEENTNDLKTTQNENNGMPVPIQPQAPVIANEIPVPMTIDANGNPIPVVFDENGKPILLQMSHTVEVPLNNQQKIENMNSAAPTWQNNAAKTDTPKKKIKKIIRKTKIPAKSSKKIETKVTTKITPMENRRNFAQPSEEKIAPKPTETYEGVKIFPLPLRKKDASSETVKSTTLKDEIAKQENVVEKKVEEKRDTKK